jgi:hypothetical protein
MYARHQQLLLSERRGPHRAMLWAFVSSSVLAAGCREADGGHSANAGEQVPMGSGSLSAEGSREAPGGALGTSGGNGPSTLCRSDRDCPVDQRCCPSGAIGICTQLDATLACPAPDLALSVAVDFQPRFEDRFFGEDDCSLQKCLSGRGARRLLSFSLNLANRGDAPMILTLRDAPGVKHVACDGSLFLDGFLRYDLFDAQGVRRSSGVGDVALTCQRDLTAQSTSPFDCNTLGLEARSYRTFAGGSDCQWVDITTVPPGQYTLRMSINADGQLAESDLANNVLERQVVISPSDPLAPCVDEVPADALYEETECGWQFMPGQVGLACVPGEAIRLECTYCNGSYLPRVCPGVEACSSAGSLNGSSVSFLSDACSSEDVCDGVGQCSAFPFTCPATGLYSVLGYPIAPFLPSDAPPTAPSAVTCRRAENSEPLIPEFGPPIELNPGSGSPVVGDAGSSE